MCSFSCLSLRTFSPFSLRISSARSVDSPRLSVLNSFSNSSPEQFQKFFSVIHTRLLFFLISVNRLCVSCKEKGTRPSLHDKHTIKVSFLSSSIYATIYTPKACVPVPCTRYVPARKRDDEIAQHLITDVNYSLIFPT